MRVGDPMAHIDRMERQDNVRQSIDKAERLVAKLKPGKNYFTPDQYRAIIFYLWPIDDDKARDQMLARGSFSPPLSTGIKRIEIVRVDWLDENRLVSLEDLSKQTGIPYKTLWSQIRKLNLPKKVIGRMKLYDIDMLREALSDIPE